MTRRWLRFSLRTMLVVVTLICAIVGWAEHKRRWIAARHQFYWGTSEIPRNALIFGGVTDAPWALRIFGEPGFSTILVPAQANDAEVARVKELFPEAFVEGAMGHSPITSPASAFGPHARGSGKVVCMTAIRVEIIRLYQNGYPDWADCRLVDAAGREHFFHEKVPVVSAADIDENSELPQPGAIGCEIIARRVDAAGREVIQVETTKPWAIESNSGESRFEVLPSQLLELR